VDTDNDGVTLTDREREALAGLAAALDDPWLSRQLAGPQQLTSRPSAGSARPWAGAALLVLGALLAVLTFTRWLWAGAAGLALMGLGGGMLRQQGEALLAWWTAWRGNRAAPTERESRPAR
jgi:hypothetical protein